jgi:hypothetical protein
MSDAISTLRGLSNENRARDEELRLGFKQLESNLVEASGGLAIHGKSENCCLERYGDDEAVYGYLFFNGSGLRVAYRSTEEDMNDALDVSSSRNPDPVYSVEDLDKCHPVWLRALAASSLIESLMSNITDVVRAAVAENKEAVRRLASTVNFPTRSLETALIDVAEKLSFSVVVQDWKSAQSALGVDAADAVTRACRLVETVCKHVLETRNQPIPPDQVIQKLFKAAAKSLTLGPDQQSSDDVRTLVSGMFTTVQGIGALRTHSGTAHGSTASRHEVTFPEARLAVNSAGVVATFLMEALLVSESGT